MCISQESFFLRDVSLIKDFVVTILKADSRLQSNVSHWLGANLESALDTNPALTKKPVGSSVDEILLWWCLYMLHNTPTLMLTC